jgi:preprotein translocase subunit YajC
MPMKLALSTLFYFILFYFILFYFILFYFILFYREKAKLREVKEFIQHLSKSESVASKAGWSDFNALSCLCAASLGFLCLSPA